MLRPPEPLIVQTGPDKAFIDVRDYPKDALTRTIIWDRAGERRVVPSHVRNDVQRVFLLAIDLQIIGVIVAIPDEWCRIDWHSCRPMADLLQVVVHQ